MKHTLLYIQLLYSPPPYTQIFTYVVPPIRFLQLESSFLYDFKTDFSCIDHVAGIEKVEVGVKIHTTVSYLLSVLSVMLKNDVNHVSKSIMGRIMG